MHDTMGNFLNDDQGNEVDEILGTTVEENLPITHRSFEGYKYIFINLNVSTKNSSVYTPESMKEAISSLEDELFSKIMNPTGKVRGSGWTLYRYNKLYSVVHTNKTPRAGSYIKTPDTYILEMKTTVALNTVQHITKLS